jgi:hypothetical protein
VSGKWFERASQGWLDTLLFSRGKFFGLTRRSMMAESLGPEILFTYSRGKPSNQNAAKPSLQTTSRMRVR